MSRRRKAKNRTSTVTIKKAKTNSQQALSVASSNSTPAPLKQQPNLLDELPSTIKTLAMAWYERGIRRGLKKATDLMLEDEIYKNEGMLHAPTTITINVKTRLNGEEWEERVIEVSAEEIGFER